MIGAGPTLPWGMECGASGGQKPILVNHGLSGGFAK